MVANTANKDSFESRCVEQEIRMTRSSPLPRHLSSSDDEPETTEAVVGLPRRGITRCPCARSISARWRVALS